MKLTLFRISDDGDSSIGYIKIDGEFCCFTLEDEHRDEKVKGETRIPAGTYKIKFREEPTPLTKKYQARFDYFHWHLMIQDVPNFDSVYIHIGNEEKHTDGCILVGDSLDNRIDQPEFLGKSGQAFKRLYTKVSSALKANEPVTIQIFDEI